MTKKSIFAWIPEDLHRELKAKLSREGRTIQDFVQQAVQAYLKEGEK